MRVLLPLGLCACDWQAQCRAPTSGGRRVELERAARSLGRRACLALRLRWPHSLGSLGESAGRVHCATRPPSPGKKPTILAARLLIRLHLHSAVTRVAAFRCAQQSPSRLGEGQLARRASLVGGARNMAATPTRLVASLGRRIE